MGESDKPADAEVQLTASGARHGIPVPPHQRVQLMSDKEWEKFVDEWANSLKPTIYKRVERHAGAGDMGIDVCAFTDASDFFSPWDNFQCKHYDHPLWPSDIVIEVGKLIYYAWRGEYSVPRKYCFCAPRDVGSTLAKLLRKPLALKHLVQDDWESKCESRITKSQAVQLSGPLLAYFEAFNFSIFSYVPVSELLDGHRKTIHYVARFGGGLPSRKVSSAPPVEPTLQETVYVNQLLCAYADHTKSTVAAIACIPRPDLVQHFERSRREFYCAEGLREFSLECLPATEYDRLKQEMLMAVSDTVSETYLDGFARVKATVKQAQTVQIDSHPLKECMNPTDRAGICHQLANDGSVKWVKN